MSDEPGEASDTALPEECAIESMEASPEAETEFAPFDEVDEDFQPGPAMRVMGPDGLPLTVDSTTESDIPALSTTTLVCMGDFSKFVIRDRWQRSVAEFTQQEVTCMPSGEWVVPAALAEERSKGRRVDAEDGFVVVEPVRPQCQHYVRQEGSLPLNPAHQKFYRLCSARRTTEGTFMTVGDTGVWACSMREPYDVVSSARFETFDARKIREGAARVNLPMFQLSDGIFDGAPKKGEES